MGINENIWFSLEPVKISGLENIVSISANGSNSLALDIEGIIWSWGRNKEGQLGIGEAGSFINFPVKVLKISNATGISQGYFHSLAIAPLRNKIDN